MEYRSSTAATSTYARNAGLRRRRMSIQRWRVNSYRFLDDEGDYVLYADHIMEMERLRSVLINVLSSARPNEKDHPTMFAAWKDAEATLLEAQKEGKG
jgi:hypothetical protein